MLPLIVNNTQMLTFDRVQLVAQPQAPVVAGGIKKKKKKVKDVIASAQKKADKGPKCAC